jgi:hypothetical protein
MLRLKAFLYDLQEGRHFVGTVDAKGRNLPWEAGSSLTAEETPQVCNGILRLVLI